MTDTPGPDRLRPPAQCARTVLPLSGLHISRIGLGFAHAHLMDRSGRVALIERALDLGVTHFDTARFYSDGLSERTLGEVLSRRRSEVTIATKFGLLPTPVIGSAGPAALPLRKGRTALNRLGLLEYPKRSYSAATLRRALHDSLRALQTDYIDIYHVHEPLPDTQLSDEVIAELQRAKAAGSIRLIGVSGDTIDSVVARYGPVFDVIQCAESYWDPARWVPDITHSLFSGAVQQSSGTIAAGSIHQLLDRALQRRPQGAVIVQTRSPQRLTQLVEFAAERTA